MAFFRVIFRTCDRTQSVHAVPRPFGLDKHKLIKLSFLSLVRSLRGHSHAITVVGDSLSDESLAFFKSFPVSLQNHPPLGNDASIRETVRLAAEAEDGEWIYFCEDDYLHLPDSFSVVNELLENRKTILDTQPASSLLRFLLRGNPAKRDLAIFLPDYPDRYFPRERKSSFLFKTSTHHFRQVTNTTFSFITQAATVKKNLKVFLKASHGANDGYLSKCLFSPDLFLDFFSSNRGLCLSPIPGLSTHTHEGTMTPLVDWEGLINNLEKEL